MKHKDTFLPPIHASVSRDTWQEDLNHIACQAAHDALVKLGPPQTVELAFALLQTYFLITHSRSLPFIEETEKSTAILEALENIFASCNLSFESTITVTLQDV